MSRHKKVITATVSPMTKRQLGSLVDDHEMFASGSDAIEKAIGMLYYAVNHDILVQCADVTGIGGGD